MAVGLGPQKKTYLKESLFFSKINTERWLLKSNIMKYRETNNIFSYSHQDCLTGGVGAAG